MITIGICDDSSEQVDILSRLIYKYFQESKDKNSIRLMCATDPELFLKELEVVRPQILLLDIDMGSWDGIALGEQIKQSYPEVLIVYITGHSQYALEAFRVRAFHYILKPLTEVVFNKVFNEALHTLEIADAHKASTKLENRICIQRRGATDWVACSDIYYFEKVGHKVKVHTTSGIIDYPCSFKELLGRLEHDRFFQCHQGYIVNLDRLKAQYQKELLLDANYRIPVSRSFSKSVKEMLAKKLFGPEDCL